MQVRITHLNMESDTPVITVVPTKMEGNESFAEFTQLKGTMASNLHLLTQDEYNALVNKK